MFIHIYYFVWTVHLKHICHEWKVSIDFENFELVMNFGRFGQTMYSNLWMVYETFRLVGQNVMYHHTIMCALHVLLKGILLNAWQMEPLNFICSLIILKISNQIDRASCGEKSFGIMWLYAPFSQIYGHFNIDARWINGPHK